MSAHRSKSLLEGYRPVTTGNKSGTAAGGAATAPQEQARKKRLQLLNLRLLPLRRFKKRRLFL